MLKHGSDMEKTIPRKEYCKWIKSYLASKYNGIKIFVVNQLLELFLLHSASTFVHSFIEFKTLGQSYSDLSFSFLKLSIRFLCSKRPVWVTPPFYFWNQHLQMARNILIVFRLKTDTTTKVANSEILFCNVNNLMFLFFYANVSNVPLPHFCNILFTYSFIYFIILLLPFLLFI